jgi:serine/threonine protein kinase
MATPLNRANPDNQKMSEPLRAGASIAGRYDVFEIHEGGMGVVYIANDRIGRPGQHVVALKTLHPNILLDSDRGGRFTVECRLWVQLGQHPNIVRAFAVENIEGRPYIIMELVTGGELKRWMGTAQLDPPRALQFGIEFCLGMEHATRQGLRCHRDIKPGNLLITESGALKITDFGIAGIRDEIFAAGDDEPIPLEDPIEPPRIVWTDPRDQKRGPSRPAVAMTPLDSTMDAPAPPSDAAPIPSPELPLTPDRPLHSQSADVLTTVVHTSNREDSPEASIARLTRTGAILGTLPYMAPEQFEDAKNSDIRSDIYSFGVVLFQMLTNVLPFQANSLARYRRAHSRYTPPSVIPALPRRYKRHAEHIDTVVQRCLSKDPSDRFPTIVDLRRALTSLSHRLQGR